MNERSAWQLLQADNLQQAKQQILSTFQNTYHDAFEDEMMGINHRLEVDVRGLKRVGDWVTGFVLTPWMLAQIFCPLSEPEQIEMDTEWSAKARTEQNYVVIGNLKEFEVAEQKQKGYLNYDQNLGHYLILPLVQLMEKYEDNEAVFAAWSQVIQFRQEHYAKAQKQLEVSEQEAEPENLNRRDFLAKWRS